MLAKLYFEGLRIFIEEVQPRGDSRGVCFAEKAGGLRPSNEQAPVTRRLMETLVRMNLGTAACWAMSIKKHYCIYRGEM